MSNKKVIIRVDGNSNIGLGHVYRGIALAEMLKEDFLIEFVTRENTTISPINESGFNYTYIPKTVTLFEEPIWIKMNYPINTIVVLDGYEFKEDYQQRIKYINFKLVYIDDLVRGTQKADLVINHSPGTNESDYKKEKYTDLALGLKYALLRKSFIEFVRKDVKVPTQIRNVFVSFGGADINDFTLKTIKEVIKLKSVEKVNVILGAAYRHSEILELDNSKLVIHKNLSERDVFTIMLNSDLAIVPASTTSIELALLGIPMLLGYFVDNQIRIYNGFVKHSAVRPIGDFHKYKFENLLKEIVDCNKEDKLERIQMNLLKMFDDNIGDNIISKFRKLC